MVMRDQTTCPKCGGELKYYDSVPRLVRTKGRETARVSMRRFRCVRCGAVHRELSELLVPYKQYEAEVIIGVLEGLITCETIGFEDYPCEMTMLRWLSQKAQLLLPSHPGLPERPCLGRERAYPLLPASLSGSRHRQLHLPFPAAVPAGSHPPGFLPRL